MSDPQARSSPWSAQHTGRAPSRLALVRLLLAGLCAIAPAAHADQVDVVGGFTQYFGPLEQPAGTRDRQSYFSIPGAYSFAASPYAAYPDLPLAWAAGIGQGNAGFTSQPGETRERVDFFIGSADQSFTLPVNTVAFTPSVGAEVQAGEVFKLGTFTFTNGGWFGGLPDSLFQLNLRTMSANPALDGHTLTTYLGLHITDGLSVDGSRYSTDPVDNADYFYLSSAPFFGGPTELLGYVGVYEAEPELQPPGGSNTGSIDLYGRIGSLLATGFANPQGLVLRDAIPVVDGLPPPVPEPAGWALLAAGLGLLRIAMRRSNNRSAPCLA